VKSILVSNDNRCSTRFARLTRAFFVMLAFAVPILIAQQIPVSTIQDVGLSTTLTNITGLNKSESGEYGSFRWGGEQVIVHLQPLGVPMHVAVLVQGVRPEGEALARVGASSEGKSLGVQEIPRTQSSLNYRLPAISIFRIWPELTFTSTTFQPPQDDRQLGIAYYRIEQSSGSWPSVPSLWPALAWILCGLLLYLAVRAITGRFRPAFISVLGLGILLGILNGFARPWLVFYSWYFVVPPLLVLMLVPWLRDVLKQRQAAVAQQETVPQPSVQSPTIRNAWPIAITVAVLGLLVMLWHLLAPAEPAAFDATHNVSWGVSFYTKLPVLLQILGVVIVTAVMARALFSRVPVESDASVQENGVDKRDRQFWKWFPWVLVFAGVLLFTFAPAMYSEGDSALFDRLIIKNNGAIWQEPELLDFFLKVKLYYLLSFVLSVPTQAFQIMAVVAGGIYLAGANVLGKVIGRTRTEALIFVAALISIGNVLFFFRYIENYALVSAVSLFVLWGCWQYVEGRMPFTTVCLIAAVAALVHGAGFWWGPMVLAAWFVRARKQPAASRWSWAGLELGKGTLTSIAVLVLVLGIIILDGYSFARLNTKVLEPGVGIVGGNDTHIFVPFFSTETIAENYTYFSWSHLGAIIQEQVLTAPLALVTILSVLAFAWRDTLALFKTKPALIVLAVGTFSALLYSISWNPDLGPRDDWDLLALSAIPLTLLAVYLLLHLRRGTARRLALASYLSVSAVHTCAWVLLHILNIHY
jgi:hypothetical protein